MFGEKIFNFRRRFLEKQFIIVILVSFLKLIRNAATVETGHSTPLLFSLVLILTEGIDFMSF